MLIHLLLPILYAIPFYFFFIDKSFYPPFVIGIVLGYILFLVDRLLHVFFVQPETEFSQQVRQHLKQGQLLQAAELFLLARSQQQQLMTRSVLFLIIYVGLAIYVMTSTGSMLGMGLILGLGLHFCLDLWRYRQDEEKFHQHFLWQLKKRLASREITYLVISFSLFFVLISMLMIRQ